MGKRGRWSQTLFISQICFVWACHFRRHLQDRVEDNITWNLLRARGELRKQEPYNL